MFPLHLHIRSHIATSAGLHNLILISVLFTNSTIPMFTLHTLSPECFSDAVCICRIVLLLPYKALTVLSITESKTLLPSLYRTPPPKPMSCLFAELSS
jgi:hypothetical protein